MSKFNHKQIVMSVMMTLAAGTMAAQQNKPLDYPVARKVDTVDDYHGQKIADPYRWLEDDNSEETKAWVEAENKVTQDYLATIPFRGRIKQRLEELWNYPKYGSPFHEGKYYYFYNNYFLLYGANQFCYE